MLQLLQRLTSPPKLTLTTEQPTRSTAHLTVSTRTAPHTLPAIAWHYVALLLRVVVGAIALLVVFAKYERAFGLGKSGILSSIFDLGNGSPATQLLLSQPWKYTVPVVTLTLWLALRRGYTEESLLILRGLGLQTSSSSSTYLYNATTRFIPTTSIQDIFIHEAFRGFEVRFYLIIVVKGEEDVVVVFPLLLPRREILELVWRGSRACLYEDGRPPGALQTGKTPD